MLGTNTYVLLLMVEKPLISSKFILNCTHNVFVYIHYISINHFLHRCF